MHKIGSLLGTSDALKALSARTRRIQELQTLYLRSAPRELAGSSRVKDCRTGTLLISADNAAVAAKLKQQAPSLLASIRKTEREITGIRIEVQVGGAASERRYKSKKIPLSPDALEKIDGLSKRVSDDGLKNALSRLVRRHGGQK
ncbi:MAG TPA: DciA family protein [Burkholderiales bacterium]|nr:DciA family protein [Burkholderiales bacterium]